MTEARSSWISTTAARDGRMRFPLVLLIAGLSGTAATAAQAAPAAPAVEGREVATEETDLARRVAARLASEPALRAGLARRILASSLAAHFTGVGGAESAGADVERWIAANPGDASHLAVGFAQDDREGTRRFEQSLYERVQRHFQLNPRRSKGILGALEAAGSESRGLIAQDKDLADEERREMVQRLFDGFGGPPGKAPSGGDPGGGGRPPPESASGPAAFAGSGMVDRLSSVNPTGFSPQVLAFQSALNARRSQGAPRLIETGRLDFPTLSHPYYGLRHDIEGLERDLAAHRARDLARLLGRERDYPMERLRDPAVQRDLESAAKGRPLNARFARRAAALEAAARAVSAFRDAAEKTKDPRTITGSSLKELGRLQKDAARWIAVAHVEAELQRLESLSGFWSEDLRRAIRSAPAPEKDKRGCLDQGERLALRLRRLQGSYADALSLLQGDYVSSWTRVEDMLAQAPALRKGLDLDIGALASISARLSAAPPPASGWRALLERWIRQLAPSSATARRSAAREREAAALLEAFGRIAAGDFAGARRLLSAPLGS